MALEDLKSISINLASPDAIRKWSSGEVKKPETINYRSLKPEVDGLFCERIFGPTKDWECHCGKYKKIKYKGKICEKCGVEITRSKVRRERMGHIELAAPVSHIWYFKGIPSKLSIILDISPRMLEKVLYFGMYIITDPGNIRELEQGQIISEKEYRDLKEKYEDDFQAGMGAESVKKILEQMDLDILSNDLKHDFFSSSGQKKIKILKRLEVVESFRLSCNRPEWMILDVLPVIPPDLRPMVQLDGGRFATSDLNDLYRRVINRNNRLKRLLALGAPDIIVKNEKRMLQEAVDALIDNGRRGRPVVGANNRPLKSLSDMLKGKQGRFRQNLLGKRVDYSGRSVIVVGPELKMYQCGLPKEMALELFKPFVMHRLVETGAFINIRAARKAIERVKPEVWDALDVVIKGHLVLLNRAPTLHRLGIQAFEPVLVEGRAIKLHPLVCYAYNADFDGDQMAVHLPLSAEAQAEARHLMMSVGNLLKPSDGKPVTVPTKDMVLGVYYLTFKREEECKKVFANEDEVMLALEHKIISLHSPIKIRRKINMRNRDVVKLIETTAGRIIFNQIIPQDLGFVNRRKIESALNYEVDFLVGKSQLDLIFDKCIKVHGFEKTFKVLDDVKAIGFKYATSGAITVSVKDVYIPESKKEILKDSDSKVDVVTKYYNDGLISDNERKTQVIKIWTEATDKVTSELGGVMSKTNPVFMMVDSGARGSMSQIKQISGMRGLIANNSGATIEVPIRSNYREGLNVLEYFIASRGARKGSSDTSLRTSDSGYLTRRLVDVAQNLIVKKEDCGVSEGIEVFEIKDGKEVIEPLSERLVSRYLVDDFKDKNGKVIVSKDKMMDDKDAEKIVLSGVEKINIRSVLRCQCQNGVCKKCYGANLATGQPVDIGDAVGIMAAQSIGEPGTQLTMKNFHTGGIVGVEDITQGLPRVEELFEARKPKRLAIISEIAGTVSIEEIKDLKHVFVKNELTENSKEYPVPYGFRILVNDGEKIDSGTLITEGSVDPRELLEIKGVAALEAYLIQEVQRVYRMQGVDINDKHIEIIVKQMLRKVIISDSGDTPLISGSSESIYEVLRQNKKIQELNESKGENLKEASYTPVVLGITKASLATDSFLSAASFQETTKVLTESAIKGKVDELSGLKENVIIANLLPAGTGLPCYNNIEVVRKK